MKVLRHSTRGKKKGGKRGFRPPFLCDVFLHVEPCPLWQAVVYCRTHFQLPRLFRESPLSHLYKANRSEYFITPRKEKGEKFRIISTLGKTKMTPATAIPMTSGDVTCCGIHTTGKRVSFGTITHSKLGAGKSE